MKPNKGDKMDTIFKTKSQRALDAEIERLIKVLDTLPANGEDYVKVSDNLKVLCAAREMKDPGGISMETVVSIGANLIGLLLVLNFERTGVITSKAFSWIWKK
jgi:hypothetical protein